ncbi:MAG: 16S rRNA (cytosine(1402)-N(4))-methyltransferase RsmH [Butyrivibrio sp.]|nr:16S rRNA (cytosine(1402)-N(4))-methyltransferase RsmH [Butyrivibrio sp.]
MQFEHIPVLLREVLTGLQLKPDGIYVDGTLGGAGHASQICTALGSEGRLIGFDQDGDAIAAATARLERWAGQTTIIRDNYEHAPEQVRALGITQVDGILLDLGVSSYQLDHVERGFSYRADAPLDMRMDDRASLTAADIVNTWPETELTRILREYGEERFAAKIARSIVARRAQAPITTTEELNDVIRASIPARLREKGGHPSKRTFQAVRIACNRELEVLEESLDALIGLLAPGGRICVITFHSLEDRIVKNAFRRNENPCTCPPEFPVCTCGARSRGHVVTRHPILPGEQEMQDNSRAKSAKLRIFEHI